MATTESTTAWGTARDVCLEIVERGRGRPILWLHGEEGLAPQAPFLEGLAAHGHVLAPSHPGFGHSPDADEIETVDDLSYLYLDLLAACDLREVVVGGDRETRDIPDIFALHPDEVRRLTYHNPARAAVDTTTLSDDELTALVEHVGGFLAERRA